MLMSKSKAREYLFELPGLRTFFSAIIRIVACVLSGIFVIEITTSSGLAWGVFYKARSFYALGALSLAIYWHNRALSLYQPEDPPFMHADYCIAYIRTRCFPEAACSHNEP